MLRLPRMRISRKQIPISAFLHISLAESFRLLRDFRRLIAAAQNYAGRFLSLVSHLRYDCSRSRLIRYHGVDVLIDRQYSTLVSSFLRPLKGRSKKSAQRVGQLGDVRMP